MEKYVVRCLPGTEDPKCLERKGRQMVFSVVDVLRALEVSANPSRYWSDFKRKLRQKTEKEEAPFRFENIVSLKLPAADQKNYKTDMLDEEGLKRAVCNSAYQKDRRISERFFSCGKDGENEGSSGKSRKQRGAASSSEQFF